MRSGWNTTSRGCGLYWKKSIMDSPPQEWQQRASFTNLWKMDVLKVLPDDQDVYTLIGPREALELHSRIGTEYLYTDLYDTLELNAIFDYELPKHWKNLEAGTML